VTVSPALHFACQLSEPSWGVLLLLAKDNPRKFSRLGVTCFSQMNDNLASM
jgi:hypothetical protein